MRALALALLLPLAALAGPEPPCGNVRLERARDWAPPGDAAPEGIVATDANGDGRDDLLVRLPGKGADAWRLLLTRPDLSFAESVLPLDAGGSPVAIADLDGDGDLDLLARSDAGRRLLRNDGRGVFTAEAPDGPRPGTSALGDLDGDGRVDLVWTGVWNPADPHRGELFVARGDGRGGFGEPAATTWDLGVDPYDGGVPVVTDADGDGRNDVVVGISWGFSPSGFLWLLRGDGRGGLSDAGRFSPGGAVSGLVASDLDRDGVAEIVRGAVYRMGGGQIRVLSRGAGGFRTTAMLETGPGLSAVVSRDLNGDGWPDLAARFVDPWASSPSGRVRLYVATPVGDLLPVGDEVPVSEAFALADLEGSGRAGVVAVLKGEAGSRLVFHRNACDAAASTLVLPVAVRTTGATGARFDTEVTLLNAGAGEARVELRDGASWGGEPAHSLALPAGSVATLSTAGEGEKRLSLGRAAGPLRLDVRGVPASHLSVAARVVSETAGLPGRATLGIEARDPSSSSAVSWIPWLLEDEADRTNLAVLNPGSPTEGDVTVRVTVVSTDAASPGSAALGEVTLPPGGFHQWNRVLRAAHLAARSGYARLERLSGAGRFDAYAVVNDAVSSDGAFLPALPDTWVNDPYRRRLLVPTVLTTDRYETELLLFNASSGPHAVELRFFRGGLQGEERLRTVEVPALGAIRIPDVPGFVGASPEGGPGGLEVGPPPVAGSSMTGVVAVSRTRTRDGARGRWGVATVASTSNGWARTARLFAPALQDAASRTNLTVVVPEKDPGMRSEVRVRVVDREGRVAATRDLDLGTSEWLQLDALLGSLAPGVAEGWIHVANGWSFVPVVAYATVNDGASPGEGSDDGAVFLGTSR